MSRDACELSLLESVMSLEEIRRRDRPPPADDKAKRGRQPVATRRIAVPRRGGPA